MTDDELVLNLELAAKAAGYLVKRNSYAVDGDDNVRGIFVRRTKREKYVLWQPHLDDGAAFRLAADVKVDVSHSDVGAAATHDGATWAHCFEDTILRDRRAAMRLAILQVAATVGEKGAPC